MSERPEPRQPSLGSTIELSPGSLPPAQVPADTTILHIGSGSKLPAPPPAQVPGYDVLEELGRGGMGVVYKARQRGLNRIVALKMILAGGHASPAELARFRTEAETIARLHHPNIIQIYEVEEHDGHAYLSLEFCAGGSLADRLSGKPMDAHLAAALLEILARAIQAAHDAGVVHRDLKPANVLLIDLPDPNAAKIAAVVPKVTDFGLAKNLDAADGQTHTGAIMGTPGYMAPEQAAGKGKDVGPAADVYALGAILYECITGRAPFVGATPLATVMQVMGEEPLPPRMLNRGIDADLEKIALKCLEKDPARRYESAAALADDLGCYRRGEPVSARSINLFERLQRELAHSQHDAALRPWGTMLIVLGALILLSHLATSLLLKVGWGETPSFWLPRALLLAVAIPLLIRQRGHGRFLPINPVERMLWAVWVGYLVAFAATLWVFGVMGKGHLDVYGVASVLSGLAWFAMGGYVWGGCYLIGILFMAAAPLMAGMSGSEWAPFAFGCLWGGTLLLMGARYRRLGKAPGDY